MNNTRNRTENPIYQTVKLKEGTPHITEGDLREHMASNPLTIIERAKHLIEKKKNESDGADLEMDVFENIKDSDLAAIMKEVYQLINVKNSVNRLVTSCEKEQEKTKPCVDKMLFDVKH